METAMSCEELTQMGLLAADTAMIASATRHVDNRVLRISHSTLTSVQTFFPVGCQGPDPDNTERPGWN
jgi:hypothetical protein